MPKTTVFRKPRLIAAIAFAAALTIIVVIFWLGRQSRSSAGPTYVGEELCAECHAEQAKAWRTSHHAQAMQAADSSTVLGDFKDAHFVSKGVSSIFFQKNNKFYVRTGNAENKLQDYEIPYTFGVYPLQQYLVAYDRGRMQAFDVAWDSRNIELGGKRWFQVDPDNFVANGNPRHWTDRNLTWNSSCADCHSTNLEKNYDFAKDTYATRWSAVNVSCEACHGPGSKHVEWGRSRRKGQYKESDGRDGLLVHLGRGVGTWSYLSSGRRGTKYWQGQVQPHDEVNLCASCHSLRRKITSDYEPGQPFLGAYVPKLLEEDAYYADGQAKSQAFEWTAFIQSKMYRQGVTCSDCHDPHSGRLPSGSTNSLCQKCHSEAQFGSTEHHHHKIESAGAECVGCHMRSQTYMGVDVGHDHSFRIPRPDLSAAYKTPNACTQCHQDKSDNWAADAIVKWFGAAHSQDWHFVEALDAARRGLPTAEKELTRVIVNPSQAGIVRATALSLLPPYFSPFSFFALQNSFGSDDPLIRLEALRASAALSEEDRVKWAFPLLTDPVFSVRIEAARLFAGVRSSLLQPSAKAALDNAVSELIASETAQAERPESHLELATLYGNLGRITQVEPELKAALRLDPNFVPAMVGLAGFYRAQNRDDECQRWLDNAIAADPKAAQPVYALALLRIKHKQYSEGMSLLGKAVALQPTDVRYSYVYAIALRASGHLDEAITLLQQAHQRRPADRLVLIALSTFERDKGNLPLAVDYAQQLIDLAPSDASANNMLSELHLASDTKHCEYWLNLGDSAYKAGDLPKSRQAYEKGRDLALAEVAADHVRRLPITGAPACGDPASDSCAADRRAADEKRARGHAFAAYFGARLGDSASAEQELQKALALSAADDKVIRVAVLTYEALGQRDRAIAVLNGASSQLLQDLNRDPDLPDFREDARFQQALAKSRQAP